MPRFAGLFNFRVRPTCWRWESALGTVLRLRGVCTHTHYMEPLAAHDSSLLPYGSANPIPDVIANPSVQPACVRPPRGLHGHAHGVVDPVVSRGSLDMQARALACPMPAPYSTTRTRLTPQLG